MKARADQGFTLVEILVVIALVGLITLLALPTISSYFRVSLNTVTRELASTFREAYNASIITGRVHRLVYDLDSDEFWVEQGPNEVLIDSAATKEREERRKRLFAKKKEGEGEPAYHFSLARNVTRKKRSLPRGASFKDVVSEFSEKPLTEGLAYTHIFPHGIAERTLVHLTDLQNHETTLVLSPVIGKTSVQSGYVKPEETLK